MTATQPPGRPLLTKADVCARLAVSLRTLDRLIAQNALPTIKVGRAVRFDPADVEAYIDAQKRRSDH